MGSSKLLNFQQYLMQTYVLAVESKSTYVIGNQLNSVFIIKYINSIKILNLNFNLFFYIHNKIVFIGILIIKIFN